MLFCCGVACVQIKIHFGSSVKVRESECDVMAHGEPRDYWPPPTLHNLTIDREFRY